MTPELLELYTLTALEEAVTAAALAAAHTRGRCDPMLSDQVAVDAMRTVLSQTLPTEAIVCAGEGDKDQAPMLHRGEALGPARSSAREALIYLAVDPLEGTNLCARGEPGAICVGVASVQDQGMLQACTDGYMAKIVLGRDLAHPLRISFHPELGWNKASVLDWDVTELARFVATHRGKAMRDVVAMVLDRPRNQPIIEALRGRDVQLKLIRDGDVTAALLALDPHQDVDFAIGIGGTVEGVLTAAMVRTYGGYMEAREWRPEGAGLPDPTLHRADDLASGHVIFALAAVTANDLMTGVRFGRDRAARVSLVSGRSRTKTISARDVTRRTVE